MKNYKRERIVKGMYEGANKSDCDNHFLRLPRIPGRGLEEVSATATVAWRLTILASSKGILGWRASWWICIDFTSGAVTLQWGHSHFACPPFSIPERSARPAFPPPRFVVAASTFAWISFAVCFFGFAFPVIAGFRFFPLSSFVFCFCKLICSSLFFCYAIGERVWDLFDLGLGIKKRGQGKKGTLRGGSEENPKFLLLPPTEGRAYEHFGDDFFQLRFII